MRTCLTLQLYLHLDYNETKYRLLRAAAQLPCRCCRIKSGSLAAFYVSTLKHIFMYIYFLFPVQVNAHLYNATTNCTVCGLIFMHSTRINRCEKLFPGNEATLNFYLTNFTDVSSIRNAVRNIRYLGGNTNTTGGLRLMRTEIFNAANGDRSDVPNVAILITDGVPTREVAELPACLLYTSPSPRD